ncbi:hypothetical protein CRG98_000620 [Punica granatum]|uniref:Uncharacterized protein n=1 Tax=Punica granatum TaxID=22663 RepID=A0A2I0LE89_PUNGR|nr:hypothetical protein CRG98_000620 [Punica granatum]
MRNRTVETHGHLHYRIHGHHGHENYDLSHIGHCFDSGRDKCRCWVGSAERGYVESFVLELTVFDRRSINGELKANLFGRTLIYKVACDVPQIS